MYENCLLSTSPGDCVGQASQLKIRGLIMWSVRAASFLSLLYPGLATACDDPAFLFDNKRLALRLWVIN